MYNAIAIDGPSGSGKSTLAKILSKELGYLYIDTGAMYRTVGLYAYRNGINPDDEKTLSEHFDKIVIGLKWIDGTQHIFLWEEDVSSEIRTPEMSMYASKVSAHPAVRAFLLDRQRDFARNGNVIMDGRDIGTVVLPDAKVKFFVEVKTEVRAKRRYDELVAKGENVTYEDVLNDMIIRDKNDSTRETAPCVPAEDAIFLDNSESLEITVGKALEIINGKIAE
jgi:cytidylate kinase